ncbi:prolyl oligopeptidase family serine peptidase [Jannaschia sp. S6380]|uniref:alpha/beta hydrolase family esterase n=1 Tax=Jannaschia sp. S6380 TaxID=2926408 RepID=UPI001FF59FE8|nr:PHB depolymerase family esterase [Jannaschia sp. S6380]MCK0166732.1 prolyl oligopeptidase family serine peptidase [Jannaschia sp. S6380]
MKALLTWLALTLPAMAQADCGRDAPPCRTANGSYHIALPEDPRGAPAVMFLHGFGGSGSGMLGLQGTVRALTSRGYAVIAPDGQTRDGRSGRFWAFRDDIGGEARDEAAFLAEVVAEAGAEHGIDVDRMILAGFSNGAFLVNYLACGTPGAFAAYAPVAGGFWQPQPEACAGPVRLLHTHGWRDSTVPLEGRPLRDGQWLQGDIFAGLTIWRAANGCTRPDPSGYRATGDYQHRFWTCASGSALELALHPGGHGVPEGWSEMMLDWFEGLPES